MESEEDFLAQKYSTKPPARNDGGKQLSSPPEAEMEPFGLPDSYQSIPIAHGFLSLSEYPASQTAALFPIAERPAYISPSFSTEDDGVFLLTLSTFSLSHFKVRLQHCVTQPATVHRAATATTPMDPCLKQPNLGSQEVHLGSNLHHPALDGYFIISDDARSHIYPQFIPEDSSLDALKGATASPLHQRHREQTQQGGKERGRRNEEPEVQKVIRNLFVFCFVFVVFFF